MTKLAQFSSEKIKKNPYVNPSTIHVFIGNPGKS